MKKVITVNEAKRLVREGKSPESVLESAILTPSARDFLNESKRTTQSGVKSSVPANDDLFGEPIIPDHEFKWEPGKDPKTKDEIRRFYYSSEVTRVREMMAHIGDRMWKREYTDGNGGNLTVRVGDNLVLCTPTLISKGFMKADDMALIDLDGNQIAGRLKRTSEAMTHLAIMKRQPKAKACCHAHPPHATAFAVAKVQPPTCLIPEAEVFLGQIGLAEYRTPGTPANADEVGRVGVDHMSILMINHGVITWGKDIEDAYWKMENTESYCKTIWVASQLGKELTPIKGSEAIELIELRKSLGMDDKREGLKECELCDNSDFRPGFFSQMSAACAVPGQEKDEDVEELVQAITTEVFSQLSSDVCSCN